VSGRHVGPGRIVSWTTLIVLLLLSFAATDSSAAGESGRRLTDATRPVAATRAVRESQFRLGDAGRPFDWSTVIGDFNHDGVPDVAIADRAPQRGSDFKYDIEFAVAGESPYDVTFTSPLPAVALQADDVDGDRDFDVLVVDPISNDVVGVWLNDGDGHFRSADPHSFSKQRRSILDVSGTSADGLGANVSRERTSNGCSGSFRDGEPLALRKHVSGVSSPLSSFFDVSSLSPRAPPAASQS
jgi:hypothetical protein